MKFSCPACGGEVDFKSRFSVFQVCPYCTSMLLRSDKDLESLGKTADLPPDMSPFQLGTTGQFERRHFTLVGKQRLVYDDGHWNEWYIIFDDQTFGWLGEAQGFLMISTPVSGGSIPDLKSVTNGSVVSVNGKPFEVEDIKTVTCGGSTGELPVNGRKGRKVTSVDLTGAGETFANIVYSDEGTELYVGRYAEFDELKFQNLREIDGW